jgi:hypothetical protein
VKESLGQATGLSPEELDIIFNMKQRGLTLEQISQEFGVELEVLKQFLPIRETVETQIDALADQDKGPYEISPGERAYTPGSDCKANSRSAPTTTEEAREPQPKTLPRPEHSHTPTFFYCCQMSSNKLHRANLLTGEQSCHRVPSYQFKDGFRWSQLPGGSLLITGGRYSGVREVVKIHTLREWAVSYQPPMHTGRRNHAAVYHYQYVYVLGGCSVWYLSECERYSCAESRWEELPALPVAGEGMSAVEGENSLYALGGLALTGRRYLDTVQMLSLDSLTWKLMKLKLPQADYRFPYFKIDTEVYLGIKKTLYSFTPLQVKAVKTLPQSIDCFSSYYSRGTLYYESGYGIRSLAFGI